MCVNGYILRVLRHCTLHQLLGGAWMETLARINLLNKAQQNNKAKKSERSEHNTALLFA